MSQAIEGSVIPGVLHRYPVRVANWPDGSSVVKHKIRVDPVVRFPGMNGDHTQGSSMMEKLKSLLGQKGGAPDLKEGYKRFAEDRDWRK